MTKSYQKDYPRPMLVRENWQNLNGVWDFCFDDEKQGQKLDYPHAFPQDARTIVVPFSYETVLSGIGDETVHQQVWYRRTLTVTKRPDKRYLLHFEGVDYLATVWVNGIAVGSHEGGYARFSFDVTDALCDGDNELVLTAEDSLSAAQPRGKQRWRHENYECWYVQTTGIWKTVWLEEVPQAYIEQLKLTPDIDAATVTIEATLAGVTAPTMLWATLSFDGKTVCSQATQVTKRRATLVLPVLGAEADFERDILHLWSPDAPNLYDLSLTFGEDEVQSYVGMRLIETKDRQVWLNHKPLYQRLILDQGYWKDSHLTPPSEQALIEDIDKSMALGFNGARKHMKTEDERYLYWADVKGFLVWSEFPAAYHFCDDMVESFTNQWMEAVRQNYNHPAIITWTPINESWGVEQILTDRAQQEFTRALYYLTKAFDPMRPVVTNDGWEHTVSDILTLHDYEPSGEALLARYTAHKDEILAGTYQANGFKASWANGFTYHDQPVIISEFGGIAFQNEQVGWGYGDKVADDDAFVARYQAITRAILDMDWICGYCYTQITDVQQEINGLMDEERQFKIPPEKLKL